MSIHENLLEKQLFQIIYDNLSGVLFGPLLGIVSEANINTNKAGLNFYFQAGYNDNPKVVNAKQAANLLVNEIFQLVQINQVAQNHILHIITE